MRGLLDWESARKDPFQLWMAALLLGTIVWVRWGAQVILADKERVQLMAQAA